MEFVDPSHKPNIDDKIELSRRALAACKRSGTKEQVAAEEKRLEGYLAEKAAASTEKPSKKSA